jgi:hypothetical protein
VNADDDNENEIPDLLENGPVSGENDLEEIQLAWEPTFRPYPVLDYTDWHVVLTLDPPPVWDDYDQEFESAAFLYTSEDKSGMLAFENTPAGWALEWTVGSEEVPHTLYVEALAPGQFTFQLELREPGWTLLDEDPVVFKTKPVVSFEKRKIIVPDAGQQLPVKIVSTEVWDGDDSGSFKTTDITATSAEVEYPSPDYQSKQLDMPFEMGNPLKPGIFAPGATERIVPVNINDEAYDEGSERFKMDLYNLSPDLIPGITESFVTIVGIDLRTDINNDGTIDPAPIYPMDPHSDDPLGTTWEYVEGTKGILVDAWTAIKVELGDVTDLTGYRVVIEKSAGSVLLATSQSSSTDISGQAFTFGIDAMPTQLWVKGVTPGSVIVSGKVIAPEGVEDPIGTYDIDKVRITVVKLDRIQDVDFNSNHHLVADPTESGAGTDYTALSEWHDENVNGSVSDPGDRRYPIAYKRDANPFVTATIKANLADFGQFASEQKITVRVRSSHNNIDEYVDVDKHDIGESSFTVTVELDFHDRVDFLESFDLQWEVTIDHGQTWISVGTTTHPVYLTFDMPTIDPIYHTVVHLGSAYGKNAANHESETSVVAAIWENFTDRVVKRVRMSTDWQVDESSLLQYWGAWAEQNARSPTVGTSVADLLVHADGKCGAWGRLFRDVLSAQGIDSVLKGIIPKQMPFVGVQMNGILVKNWSFDESFGFNLPNNYGRAYRTGGVGEQDGIPAQGNPDPRSTFTDHLVVEYAGGLYDPSYGGGPYNTLLDWENAALAGVGYTALNTQGQPQQYVLKHIPTRQDTEFQ